MRNYLAGLAVAAASLMIAGPASASLIGSTVTGSMTISGINYFNPAKGYVPSTGYLNSSSQTNSTSVAISGSKVEFGFADGANTDTADFNGGSLKLTDVSNSNSIAITYTFIDAAFAGLQLVKNSDTFLNGGVTASLVGTTLTIDTPAFSQAGTYAADFSFTAAAPAAAVPEPGMVALLGLGLCGIAAVRRKFK